MMYDFKHEFSGITREFGLLPFSEKVLFKFESNYNSWFYDQEVTKYNSHGLFPQTKQDTENFFNNLGNNNLHLALIDTYDSRHIGNLSLQNINFINRSAEFAIIIGEPSYWGKGISLTANRSFHPN